MHHEDMGATIGGRVHQPRQIMRTKGLVTKRAELSAERCIGPTEEHINSWHRRSKRGDRRLPLTHCPLSPESNAQVARR
jgi:hypothetical protein